MLGRACGCAAAGLGLRRGEVLRREERGDGGFAACVSSSFSSCGKFGV